MNLSSFVGGGIKEQSTIPATDGIHFLVEAEAKYPLKYEYEAIEDNLSMNKNNESFSASSVIDKAFEFRYRSAENLHIPSSATIAPESSAVDFMGIECTNLILDGILATTYSTSNLTFAGAVGDVGTNYMQGVWDFMSRGGDSGDGATGGIGFSAGGISGGGVNCGYASAGGGLIFIIAKTIKGSGTIKVDTKRDNGYGWCPQDAAYRYNHKNGGGGGIILIITEKWSGTVGLDVLGGIGTTTHGQEGSYAILKRNQDGTLTLMVHSRNGVSADLNSQTPVHGADASIAW